MSSGTRAALVIGIFCALATGASAADYGKDAKKTDGRKGGLSVSVEAGLGYDSNVFLTPENPYVDLSLLVPVTITPDKQTGFFVPLGLDAEYLRPMGTGARLLSDFGFDGQIYEPDIDNANLYDAEFTLGPEFGLTKNSSLYAGIILGYHRKIYYDRDDGLNKVSGASDISDKYTYSNAGGELIYKHDLGKLDYEVFASFEKRDYEDPVVVSQYDHDYMKFGGSLDYALAKSTKVSAGYKYTVRDYNDRKARDLGGNLLTSNPQLEYTYHTIDLTLRQRVSDSLVAYVDYTRQDRKDEFVGYNDYGQNRYKVRAIYTPTEELRVRVAASYWDREYDRAFAFDDPAGGKKDYSGITFDAGVDYGYSKQVSFWADLNYDSQDTTDKRYEYDRTQLSAGVKYEF
ncbi:MAG: hypothetical protein A2052_02515 [Deltaproteobacteria bacterium GWA2_54_12]|nr:MAG: hypothetical protein A2052_02515 [Deltaproteobacteria bacterium GWA2_54_12]